MGRSLTCALLQVACSFAMHSQPAAEVLLPELGEPDVSPVVGQRAAAEIPVERCGQREKTDG